MTTKKIAFSKYHGLGNDFIVIDNRRGSVALSPTERQLMCDRRYGIGADGLILIGVSVNTAFVLDYYNADGHIGSLCGNGSRCGLAFARELGLVGEGQLTFDAYDGKHTGRFIEESQYAVGMNDRCFDDIITLDDENYFVDTGSPHHVRFSSNLRGCDVITEGRQLRYGKYKDTNGANINFVEVKSNGDIFVRTYERGVEDETEACGTGAVAVALVTVLRHIRSEGEGHDVRSTCEINMGRGKLSIGFDICEEAFTNIELIGDATHVFDGTYFLQADA